MIHAALKKNHIEIKFIRPHLLWLKCCVDEIRLRIELLCYGSLLCCSFLTLYLYLKFKKNDERMHYTKKVSSVSFLYSPNGLHLQAGGLWSLEDTSV